MNITNEASEKVAALMKEENDPTVKLRVYVQGGGCSGMKYGFEFDSVVNPDDLTIKNETFNVTVVIDAISFQYLENATIDYKDDKLNGSRFVINNPDVQHTCGCGESFS